jgi:hypothetical protein
LIRKILNPQNAFLLIMPSLKFHKKNVEIRSVEDWFRLAPPKKGSKQWKDGRSAKELAKRWFPTKGRPKLPEELAKLLNSHPDLRGTLINEGIPEHKVELDGFPGETRNADLVLLGKKDDKVVCISVEAKADEEFDRIIDAKLKAVENKPSNLPKRIDLLCRSLFGKTVKEFPALKSFRYQLLAAVGGALIEAKIRKAALCLFVVHVFLTESVDFKKVEENSKDFDKFIQLLSGRLDLEVKDGELIEPIYVKGGPFVPINIPLYIGKIVSNFGRKS